jgi:cytochrome c oxidase subunit 3
MATVVHEPPKLPPHREAPPSASHDGGWGGAQATSRQLRVEDSSPASRTGVWVLLASITMTFAAFTSAMVVREGSSYDWRHFMLPSVLYFNTAVLVASSVALEIARKRVAAYQKGLVRQRSTPLFWLCTTLALGLLFVGGQYMAWLKLRSEGLYLATNPSSSFFYLFTVLHALHILGGLAGLTLVIRRFSKAVPTLRLSTMNTVSYYWHFMDVLWIYLLILLWTRI